LRVWRVVHRLIRMNSFRRNIEPAFRRELNASKNAADKKAEFAHLERAHVLGQASTVLHVNSHVRMAACAIRERDLRELGGQIVRILGAAVVTGFGAVPTGNTGGANVSPFQPMPIPPDLAAEIESARRAS
jgi:Protein of unknown function (DUF3703)